jgi:predicted anti-sigma-YlaC factor YlaD
MGPMNDLNCEVWRELLAAMVFDDLDEHELVALEAHLEGCAECRALAHELSETHAALALANPNAIRASEPVPAALSASVLGTLRHESRVARRRQVTNWSLSLAAAVVVVAVLVGTMFAGGTAPQSSALRTEVLHGVGNATAVAVLTPKSWGTSLHFRESGLPGRGQYTVSMRTADGSWWVAGTYRAINGGAVVATMACSVAARDITGVRVMNAAGAVVLDSGTYREGGRLPVTA